MKPGRWRRTDGVAIWLAAASLCALAGHGPVRKSGAADREALVALSNSLPSRPRARSSSSNTGTGSDLFVPVILTASGAGNSYYTSELTLTNRGSQTATLRYTYRADYRRRQAVPPRRPWLRAGRRSCPTPSTTSEAWASPFPPRETASGRYGWGFPGPPMWGSR